MNEDVKNETPDPGNQTADQAPEGAGEQDAQDPVAELAEQKEKYVRLLAEMENLRRRHARDLEEARKYAASGFARDLLEIPDNLDRALAAVPEADRTGNKLVENLLEGVELTRRMLLQVFEKHKIVQVAPARGDRFDPKLHQAMFEVPTDELPPGCVADVMQVGYLIDDRLLRPSFVGVTKALPQPEPAPDDDAAEPGQKIDTNA